MRHAVEAHRRLEEDAILVHLVWIHAMVRDKTRATSAILPSEQSLKDGRLPSCVRDKAYPVGFSGKGGNREHGESGAQAEQG